MQYAKIIVNSKTSQIFDYFTYKIPSEILPYIKPGSIVKITFGKKEKIGIVYKLIKKPNYKFKNKLKTITSLVYPFAIFNELDFEIANIIARYYLISIGKVLFFMLPKISKKTKISLTNKKIQKDINKKYRYLVFDSKFNRYRHYEKIIRKVLSNKKSIILLFPDFDANFEYIRLMQKKYNSIIYFPKMTISQKTKNYIKLKNENSVLVIGTRSTIFNIPNNLDLIIIDEPTDFGYKEEQSIHYDCLKISIFVSNITNCKILIGDDFYYNYKYTNEKIIFKNYKYLKDIKIIYGQNDIRFPVGYNLEDTTNKILAKNKNVLFLVKNENDFNGLICQDCGYIYKCKICNNILKIKNKNLYCNTCKKKYSDEYNKCKMCQSTKLKGFGLTTKNFYQKISKIYKKELVQIIDSKNSKINNKKKIFITSKNNIKNLNNLFDYAFLINWQDWSYTKNINFIHETLKFIYKISAIIKNKFYIQTGSSDKLLEDLSNKNNYIHLIKNDLINKKKFFYPPFYGIIKISLKNKEKNKCQKNIEKLKYKLEMNKLNIKIDILPIKNKGKLYISSLIIRFRNLDDRMIKKYLLKNYKNLELNKYIIDVNPIELV